MKIIENNYNKKKNKKITCPICNSMLELDEYDCSDDEIICPCCKEYITTNGEEIKEITINNIAFPNDFYIMGSSNDAVDIEDNKINNMIKECIDWLVKNPNEPYKYMGTGNTFVAVFNHNDEYYIIVDKNYFECTIFKH